MRYRIAVDTGGTFSDVVLLDEDGELSLSKAPTTPERVFDGISEALRRHPGVSGARRTRARAPPPGAAPPDCPLRPRAPPRHERHHHRPNGPHGLPHDRGLPRHARSARGRKAPPLRLPDAVPETLRPPPPDLRGT